MVLYGDVYFSVSKEGDCLAEQVTELLKQKPSVNSCVGKGKLYSYHDCSSFFLEGREESVLMKMLDRLNREHSDIPFRCMVCLDNGGVYFYQSDNLNNHRYFFVQRHRCAISRAYIEENLDNSYLVKPFRTYAEAYSYMRNGFWDDSCYGVYYKTDEGNWLLVTNEAY